MALVLVEGLQVLCWLSLLKICLKTDWLCLGLSVPLHRAHRSLFKRKGCRSYVCVSSVCYGFLSTFSRYVQCSGTTRTHSVGNSKSFRSENGSLKWRNRQTKIPYLWHKFGFMVCGGGQLLTGYRVFQISWPCFARLRYEPSALNAQN